MNLRRGSSSTTSTMRSSLNPSAGSLLAAAGIGPTVEEARDVRSRIELLVREMSKAGLETPGRPSRCSSSSTSGGRECSTDSARRNSVVSSGGISDTDGEGGGPGRRASLSRRRKGRGRRPGSESESEGGAGPNSWVYVSKAWALKWATCAYPGAMSNHHVVCRHGRVKPNVGVKR